MAYTKLANSILTSTIWMESDHTRLVWLTMLAMADKNGEVQASIPGLANVARVPLESCVKAIEVFLSPDEYSRTKTDEGRRIEEIKGGWLLINFAEYRRLASDEDRKEKANERKRNQRERDARNSGVTCHKKSHQNSQADTDTDTDTKAEADTDTKAKRKEYSPLFETFWSTFPSGRKTKKGNAATAWKKAIAKANPQTIIDAAAEYAASHVGQSEYVQGPEPWLNGECWDDDREAWKEKQSNGKQQKSWKAKETDESLADAMNFLTRRQNQQGLNDDRKRISN